MNFIVEDGTGLSNATSFISVEDADTYISTFILEDAGWSSKTVQEKESLLMRATRFVNTLMRWDSFLVDKEQSLTFPRKRFLDNEGREVKSDSVPSVIKEATAELAVESLTTELTVESEKLSSESFGDTTDTYASPVTRGGSVVVRRIIKKLSYLGYGTSKTNIVTLQRA